MLVAGEEAVVEGVSVSYSAVGLPPAACPFAPLTQMPELQGQKSAPS